MNQQTRVSRTARLIMALVFCFTAPTLARAAQKIDACALLTRAEIQAVLNQNVGEGKINPNSNPAVGAPCGYTIGAGGVFSILAKTTNPGETAAKVMAELKKRKIPVSEAPGIGDRSFFSSPGYGMVQLNTFKGGHYLIITMLLPGTSEAAQKAAAGKLMSKALKKI